ncbi:ATP-binding protein [Flavitalea sp. BT771]|uniref:sensor histidine kinase n=1 Tax=Flavitalea sp. BT771 TaxID=3063329 RepID=UPI0026E3EFE8|nr:ATP-binding protein [Flavitalea sp. BT771]MDO6432669.1 ATP-binding protein [Flavitalea sp. BT771]MDV6222055.1 ATP-binding protein [Flavitalea sp. BT771]
MLRLLSLTFIYLLAFTPANAQTGAGRYNIVNYNSDNALPQNSINGMAFDRNGFLWMATKMGIVRFDGRNFREYNQDNCPALHGNEYSLPQVAASGRILIKPVNDHHLILAVNDLCQIETDSLLSSIPYQFTTSNNHLFYCNNIRKTQASEKSAGKYAALLDKLGYSKGLVTINEKQAYFKDGDQCYFLNENTGSISSLPDIAGHSLKLQFAVGDTFIYIDSLYRLYAYKEGILQKNITAGAGLHRLLREAAAVDPDPVQASLKIRRDDSHTLMVCHDTIRLIRMADNVLEDVILAAGAPIKDIKCMVYDEKMQALFIGTITSGLYVLKMHQFQRLYFESPRFMANSQFAQIEVPDGILTSTGLLSRTGKGHRPFAAASNPDKQAWLKASDGFIWYSENGFLKRADTGLHTVISMSHIEGSLTGIIERKNKEVLYSTLHQLCLERGNGRDTVLCNNPSLLQGAEIQTICEIGKDIIWIGTSKGLFTYNLSLHLLQSLPSTANSSVAFVFIAGDSSIWMGTYGQGYYKYYDGRFVRMPMDGQKSLSIVHCIKEDRKGFFWITTNRGLFRVTKHELDNYAAGNPGQLYYYYIDKTWGFSTNEFNGRCTPCGIVTGDRHFFFPSLDGLVGFDPDSLHIVLPDKPIFIDRVMADDKKTPLRDKLVERQDSNRLSFDICSPFFGSKNNLQLEYSIKEISGQWYPLSENGRLILTRLGKGEYTLAVRKLDRYAHYTCRTVQLTILPYWYETFWFRCLLAGLGVGVCWFFFRVRYNLQVKKAELLERKVEERTVELSESNRVKELMVSVILHDLRSPLRFLQMLSNLMYDDHKTKVNDKLSNLLLQFRDATNDIYDFTQGFFVFINMQKKGFVVRRKSVVLKEMIEDIFTLYGVGARLQENIFVNLVPEDLTLDTDAGLLSVMIRNLVDNANKYTKGGEIKIEASQHTLATHITITDAGQNMDEALVKSIVEKTYNPADSGHGWGYKIVIEILDRLNGTLAIDTSAGKGNKITIVLNRED